MGDGWRAAALPECVCGPLHGRLHLPVCYWVSESWSGGYGCLISALRGDSLCILFGSCPFSSVVFGRDVWE